MSAVKVGAGIAMGAIATLTGVVAKVGISYNAMAENSQVAWTTLLGTQEKAKKMFKDIADFAKKTQFDTTSVDMMAKYMYNAGYAGQQLFDKLTEIADVSGPLIFLRNQPRISTANVTGTTSRGCLHRGFKYIAR
jgi:hypothetical protein